MTQVQRRIASQSQRHEKRIAGKLSLEHELGASLVDVSSLEQLARTANSILFRSCGRKIEKGNLSSSAKPYVHFEDQTVRIAKGGTENERLHA